MPLVFDNPDPDLDTTGNFSVTALMAVDNWFHVLSHVYAASDDDRADHAEVRRAIRLTAPGSSERPDMAGASASARRLVKAYPDGAPRRCYCERSACQHEPAGCTNAVTGEHRIRGIGLVCPDCSAAYAPQYRL